MLGKHLKGAVCGLIAAISSTPTAIMGAIEPVTSVVLCYVFLGEGITLRIEVGMVLILSAVTLIILDERLRRALSSSSVVRHGGYFFH